MMMMTTLTRFLSSLIFFLNIYCTHSDHSDDGKNCRLHQEGIVLYSISVSKCDVDDSDNNDDTFF